MFQQYLWGGWQSGTNASWGLRTKWFPSLDGFRISSLPMSFGYWLGDVSWFQGPKHAFPFFIYIWILLYMFSSYKQSAGRRRERTKNIIMTTFTQAGHYFQTTCESNVYVPIFLFIKLIEKNIMLGCLSQLTGIYEANRTHMESTLFITFLILQLTYALNHSSIGKFLHLEGCRIRLHRTIFSYESYSITGIRWVNL